MNLPDLIAALARPEAYPFPVGDVVICQTHLSVVFLAGPFAYKIKKPVHLSFVDFSTLERRRHFCDEEIRLNRRLAPTVYLGVVPVTCSDKGLTFEGSGNAIEWAVKMERLPAEATLRERLRRGEVGPEIITALARKVAAFHASAEGGERIASGARLEAVARNVHENFEGGPPEEGITSAAFERVRSLTEAALSRCGPLIEARAQRGVPRDLHGDLRLDHVYLFPERTPPADLVVVDCIEFTERFRFIDPVADVAFLHMDLLREGRGDLARTFVEAYFQATGDGEGRQLLSFYTAYRAAVRGKVEGIRARQPEVSEIDRTTAITDAAAYWLLALTELESPARRPCLILTAGLPGSGKSTLATALGERCDFEIIRTDVVRKEIAAGAAGLYSPERIEQTYRECQHRAEALLADGRRVLVDANFRKEQERLPFLESAVRRGVPVLVLSCRASPEVVRDRLAGRCNDASDADWKVYCLLAPEWQEPGELARRFWREIGMDGSREQNLAVALAALREHGLAE